MSDFSNYLENALLDHTLGGSALTAIATPYIALYTTDPTDADSGTEVTGGSYARQTATFNAGSGGSADNSATITFPTASAAWGTITHIGIHDAVSGGNLLYHGALAASKTIGISDIFQINSGDLVITLD
jgi:hypothetical protein